MKLTTHTPDRLVFEHRAVGMEILAILLLNVGLGAGGATMAMHETWALGDESVLLGLGLILATLVLTALVVWKGVRARRLVFDADAHEVRYASRSLGGTERSAWLLHELEAVEVYRTRTNPSLHAARLRWSDGTETRLSATTERRSQRHARTINEWLAEARRLPPLGSP